MGSIGKEREEEDWKKIFEDVGFSDYKFTPALGYRYVIEVYPQGFTLVQMKTIGILSSREERRKEKVVVFAWMGNIE